MDTGAGAGECAGEDENGDAAGGREDGKGEEEEGEDGEGDNSDSSPDSPIAFKMVQLPSRNLRTSDTGSEGGAYYALQDGSCSLSDLLYADPKEVDERAKQVGGRGSG